MRKGTYLLFLIILLSIILPYFTESKPTQQQGTLEVYFCPDDCLSPFLETISTATTSLDCALFEVDHPQVQSLLLEKSKRIPTRIVTDNNYEDEFPHSFVKIDEFGLMHNKFCIINNLITITGSTNPTENGFHKNNNNLIIINSLDTAENYQQEFNELWSGIFKEGARTAKPTINLNEQTTIETYFCPEDNCANIVKEHLKTANESIYFMTFSFTHPGIANILLLKHRDGINVQGIMEARQVTEYSQFQRINYSGIEVQKDNNKNNKNNMHHKVFIIDNKTVITGSFNPTNGGDRNNDENIVIIHNTEVARSFSIEFSRLKQ